MLFRLLLEEGELLFNFTHVGLEREPKVVLMLPQHVDQLLVIRVKGPRDLIERLLHLPNVGLETKHHRVVDDTFGFKLRLYVIAKRFKN